MMRKLCSARETTRTCTMLPYGNLQQVGHGCGRTRESLNVCDRLCVYVRKSVCKCVCVKEILVMFFFSTVILTPSMAASVVTCQGTCVCASNIISCSQRNLSSVPTSLPHYTAVLDLSFNSISQLRAYWSGVHLRVLHTLLLSHNSLRFMSLEAFVYVKRLRHLDLSSNALTQLDELIFEPLQQLEVLLLYNNRISKIDQTAFSGLINLQKLYLSQNRVTRFPLELFKDWQRLEKLRLLDVSYNQIRKLPLLDLQALPAWLKNGVYFHSNPLECSCELYGMLIRWQQQELWPVTNFPESHVCMQSGKGMINVSVLQLHVQLNCSTVRVRDEEAIINQLLILDCDSRYKDVTKTWLVPVANSSARLLPDGRLQVGPLQMEDSGEYTCLALGEGLNESVVVMVRVHNSTQGLGDSLNTAYTTLVCCLLCLTFVVVYLYVPPHCCSYGNHLVKGSHADSILSVSFSDIHALQGASASKQQAAYHECEELNLALEKEDNNEGPQDEQEGRKRRSSDVTDSISSDTPIMV